MARDGVGVVDADHVVGDGFAWHCGPAAESHGLVVLVRIEELGCIQDEQARCGAFVVELVVIFEDGGGLFASVVCTRALDHLLGEVDD